MVDKQTCYDLVKDSLNQLEASDKVMEFFELCFDEGFASTDTDRTGKINQTHICDLMSICMTFDQIQSYHVSDDFS